MFTNIEFKNGKINFTDVYEPAEILSIIDASLNYYKDKAEEAIEQSKRTKEEVRQEVINEYAHENAEIQKQLTLSYGSFTFPEEKKRFDDFRARHIETCRTTHATGGLEPYVKVVGTGIGDSYTVVCPVCGESENITYVDGW